MAMYEDFDLDVTVGNGKKEDGVARLPSYTPCYTDYETCDFDCSGDTCTGIRTRPCDR